MGATWARPALRRGIGECSLAPGTLRYLNGNGSMAATWSALQINRSSAAVGKARMILTSSSPMRGSRAPCEASELVCKLFSGDNEGTIPLSQHYLI